MQKRQNPHASFFKFIFAILGLVVGLVPFICSAAVSVEGSWTTGLTHTVSGGSNRLLVFVTGHENSGDIDITGVTYGGQAMTLAEEHVTSAAGWMARIEMYTLDEAGIEAASGNTFVVTYASGPPTLVTHAAATFSGVDQTTPVTDTAKDETSSAPLADPIEATVNVNADGLSVSGALSGNSGSYAWGNGWDEDTDQTYSSTMTMSTAHHQVSAAGTDTASADYSSTVNRQVIVAASLKPASVETDTMLGWAEDSDSDMHVSVWDGNTFPDGTTGPGFATATRWIVAKSNPARAEKIMGGLAENGSSDTVYVSVQDADSGTWGDQISSIVSTTSTRCFDIAVENDSGQVLVVANDNGTGLKYWVWDGSSWIVDGSAYPTSMGSGSVNWVRLATRPHSDEIAMVVLKDNAYVYGAIWDGSTNSWGNQQTLESSASATSTEAVAVEYINGGANNGHAMFVWGKSGDDCQFRRWNGSSWETGSNVGIWTTAAWMTLEADPNSPKLALTVTSTGGSPSPVNVMVYSGTAWENYASLASTTNNTERQAYGIFESATGHEGDVIFIYADGSYGRYRHYDWNGSSYSMNTAQWYDHSIDIRWTHMSRTTDGTILIAAKDTDDDLNTWSWDNSSWTHENELAITMQSAGKQDFMITPALLTSLRNFSYYREITIDADKIPASCTSDLSDYPLLVEIDTDADLKSATYGGHVQSADGYDIVFSSSGGSARLDHEIEQYDPTTGTLVAWVRIPTLSYDAATTIRMYYGNGNVDTSQENTSGVWASHYEGVWHLEQDPAAAGSDGIKDSTANAYHGTDGPNMDASDQVGGQIGGSLDFDGIDDEVITTQNFSPPADGTVSMWIKVPGTPSSFGRIFGLSDGFEIRHSTDAKLYFDLNLTGSHTEFTTSTLINNSSHWYHIAAIFSATDDTYDVYVDGSSDKSNSLTLTAQGAAQLTLGDRTGSLDNWVGTLDEFRISSEQSVCQVQTDYNSQRWNNKSEFPVDGFITVGNEIFTGLEQGHFRWRNDDGGETTGGSGITVGDTSNGQVAGGQTITFEHVVSGDNRLLIVGVSIKPDSNQTVSSIVWKDGLGDEQSLTKIDSTEVANEARVEIWKLLAPNAGTANIGVTFSATLAEQAVAGAVTLTGVDQTTPLDTYDGTTGSGSSASHSIPSDSGDVVFNVVANAWKGWTATAGQDVHWNVTTAELEAAGATLAGSATQTTFTWSMDGSDIWASGGIAINPSTGATWPENEDVKLTGLAIGTTKRVRFGVSNHGDLSSGSVAYQLQTAEADDCSAGTYTAVPTDSSGDFQIAGSTFITDGEASANVDSGLTDDATTFVAGELKDTGNTTGAITLDPDEFTEIEFAVKPTSNATDGGNYCFRLYNTTGSTALNTYSVYAQVSLAGTSQDHYRWRNDTAAAPGSVDVSIASDDDDGEESAGGNMDLGSSDLELVYDGNLQQVGLRFLNVTIPQGATVTNAYIQFTADNTDSGTVSVTIHGQDIDNAPAFTTDDYNISGRTKTNASVAWNNIPSWTSGDRTAAQKTPDITSVVQEIVNLGTWASGNDMVFIITGSDTSAVREAEPGSTSGEEAALHIEYTPGASWAAAEDTKLTGLGVGTTKRVRFGVSNQGAAGTGAAAYQLQVAETPACSSGAYTAVPTDSSGDFKIADSTLITDGEATTDIASGISNEAATFLAGELKDAGNTTGSIALGSDQFTEIEFAVQATSNATESGDYCFRLYDTTADAPLDSYSAYAEVSVAGGQDLTQTHYRWRNDNGPEADGGGASEASATASTAGANPTSFTLIDGMSLTPGAGDYLAWFSSSMEADTSGIDPVQSVSLYKNSVQTGLEHTERHMTTEDSIPNTPFNMMTHAYIGSVGASEPIEARWKNSTSSYGMTMHERTLTAMPVSSSNVSQATATADTTVAPDTTYTQIDSMSLTPGAGDYLVFFSGSVQCLTASSYIYVSLFVNGSQYAHTERIMFEEGSIIDNLFPFSLQAKVSGLQAGQTIDVRWKSNNGTNQLTMKQRSLTALKITAADASEATATATTSANPASYTQVNSMSINAPSDGNYLVFFSSSLKQDSDNDQQYISIFVNGSQETHTERELLAEASVSPSQYWPVALHAYVTGVTSGQTIDVRWKNYEDGGSTGNINMYPRTLTVYKVPAGTTAATFYAAQDGKLGIDKEQAKRLRLQVFNAGGDAPASNPTLQLQVAETATCSSGTYYAVGGSTGAGAHWEMVATDNITDGETTQNVSGGLTDPGGGAFSAGELKDAGDTTGGIDLAAGNFTEVEYAIQPTTSATSDGNYCFQLYDTANAAELESYDVYAEAKVLAPTKVDLVSFGAKGQGADVRVSWETAQEVENKGFDLYRGPGPGGPWQKLNENLLPAKSLSGEGRSYSFTDIHAQYAKLYYYRLEDVDVHGSRTTHGPICVDWDGDGMPDDWELAHGLNPLADDSLFDNDNDGLSNLEEYLRGTDPNNGDTDGDGILDGDEFKDQPRTESGRSRPMAGVDIISEDDSGITLELSTSGFDFEEWTVGGQLYERLTIPDYINGHTDGEGYPMLPLKGVLVDVPVDKSAELTVLEVDSEPHSGYQVYPVPTHELSEAGQIREVFFYNQQAYGTDEPYPGAIARLAGGYVFRDRYKQKIVFYPIAFNPVTGQLQLHARIRVRIDFTGSTLAAKSSPRAKPWSPPDPAQRLVAARPGDVYSYASSWQRVGWHRPGHRSTSAGEPPGQRPAFSAGFIGYLPSFLFSFAALPASLWTAPEPGSNYKIRVDEEGIYRITGSWLSGQGLSAAQIDAIDLSRVSMYYLGDAVAVNVYDGNGNDTLDTGDHIEFYAQPMDSYLSKYARYNVYWLTAGGAANRMRAIDGTPALAADAATHRHTVRHELDQLYLMSGRGTDDIDRWVMFGVAFGDGIAHAQAGLARDFTIHLPDVSGAGTGDLTIHMYSPYDGNHRADVHVNGAFVDETQWSGIRYHTATFTDVSIASGDNTVSVTCTSGEDKIVFDWFSVTYDRGFAANTDLLKFSHDPGYRHPISGFTSSDIAAYDITDPLDVKRVTGAVTSGVGPYTITFEPPDDATDHSYMVLTDNQILAPSSLQASQPHSLASGDNGADWIMITHRGLGWDGSGDPQPWLRDLLALREAQGLRAKAVDVAHIYDAFSYGIVSVQAIKDFLSFAYENWTAPAPKYVLIVGDATYDIKDNWGAGSVTYVPTYLTFTDYLGETATDQWFVQIAGEDALPDLSIGRLPANSVAEAEAMVGKIIAYEQAENTKSWEKAVLLTADNQSEAFESVFETINEDAAAMAPSSMDSPYRFYLQEYQQELLSVADLTADLVNALNTGALVVNYAGHASYNMWASERIWDNRGFGGREDCELLTNTDRYPLVISMSCLAGYFIYPEPWTVQRSTNYHSLAEAFIRPADHGAVAAVMPTGMSTTAGQHILNNAIFEQIFTNDRRIIGDALLNARLTLLANTDAEYQQISDTFLLFGDPATTLKLPLPRKPLGITAKRSEDANILLTWQAAADCNGDAAAGYNVYRRSASESSFIRLNSELLETLAFIDATNAPATLYYYSVTSVDEDGDESVMSIAVTPAGSSSSSKKPVALTACFVDSVNGDYDHPMLISIALLAMSLLPVIVCILCRVASGKKR